VTVMLDSRIEPHGGALVDLVASPERIAELRQASRDWPSWELDARHLCDLELLINGAFSPLRGFLGRRDYESVCDAMRPFSSRMPLTIRGCTSRPPLANAHMPRASCRGVTISS